MAGAICSGHQEITAHMASVLSQRCCWAHTGPMALFLFPIKKKKKKNHLFLEPKLNPSFLNGMVIFTELTPFTMQYSLVFMVMLKEEVMALDE